MNSRAVMYFLVGRDVNTAGCELDYESYDVDSESCAVLFCFKSRGCDVLFAKKRLF